MNAKPLLLDGATATELERAGLPMTAPWWTTRALLTGPQRAMLARVHLGYLEAGADVLTANTFRCNLRALRAAGLDAAGLGWMVHAAVGVAQAARAEAGRPEVRIAGSMAPVEDCYRPELVPDDEDLRAEHRWLATELVRAGVDLVLVETMNSAREARIAVAQVVAAGAEAWAAFACTSGARLLSGEDLVAAARGAVEAGASTVLVNCTTPEHTTECLAALAGAGVAPLGAYPNLEQREAGYPADPPAFAELAARWHEDRGLAVAGGCCGSTPAHLAALRDRLASRPAIR